MSLNKKKLYLQLGVESDEVIVDTDVPAENETLIAADLDAEADNQDLDNEVTELDDFTTATDAVEDLTVAVEAAVASGRGLTKIEAAALTKALQSCAGRYIDIENNVVPATESYDVAVHDGRENTEHNKEQTKEASKGLKATLKAFIDAIIKKLKSVGKMIMDVGKSIKDRLGRGETKLKWAYEELKKAGAFGPQQIEFNLLNVHIDGKFDFDTYVDSLEKLTKINEIVLGAKYSDEETKFLDAGISAVKESGGNSWEKFRDALNGHALTTFAAFGKDGKKGENEYESKTFPGGRVFVLEAGQSDGSKQLSTIRFRRNQLDGERETMINVPGSNDLTDMVDMAFMAYNTFRTNFQRNSSRMIDNLNKTAKALGQVNVREETEIEGDKGRISSLANYEATSKSFVKSIWDYNLLMAANSAEIAIKASVAYLNGKEQKKEETA